MEEVDSAVGEERSPRLRCVLDGECGMPKSESKIWDRRRGDDGDQGGIWWKYEGGAGPALARFFGGGRGSDTEGLCGRCVFDYADGDAARAQRDTRGV